MGRYKMTLQKVHKGKKILVFNDPEPELWYESNPFFQVNTAMEEQYKYLQRLPKFLSFGKRKQKLT